MSLRLAGSNCPATSTSVIRYVSVNKPCRPGHPGPRQWNGPAATAPGSTGGGTRATARKVEEGLGEEIEDRVGRQGTEVADDAGGGEPVLGGQYSVEVHQTATCRRCSRSQEDGDGLQVAVVDHRRSAHRPTAARNASGGMGSRTRGMR